jgi:hypothetical protein
MKRKGEVGRLGGFENRYNYSRPAIIVKTSFGSSFL